MAKDLPVDRRFDAYQDFALGCKLVWTRELFPALRARWPEDQPLEQYFGWFERHLQRMKYSGRHGLVPHFAGQRAELEAELAAGAQSRGLELVSDFQLPDYYVAVDIHQHPGGVSGDDVAGYVYERGARTTTPLLREDADLHHRFTAQVLARAPDAQRLVDLGCGFGKSSRPFYSQHRSLDVTGVELSAPCLKLAARTADHDQARNVRFRQADAASTGLEPEAYDVVTSTMLLHEMPPSHIERTLAESFRLLAPGGLSIHLDFLTDDDEFRKHIHYGHARRNNEPFMPPLNEMDLAGAHRRAGFDDVEIVPFEEMPGTLAPGFEAWRFPWAMIIARKPA